MRSFRLSETNRIINEDRTFFCSELVAKAFKTLHIMIEDGRSSCQFYPSHFTSKGDSVLNLSDGTTIDPEVELVIESYYPTELPVDA